MNNNEELGFFCLKPNCEFIVFDIRQLYFIADLTTVYIDFIAFVILELIFSVNSFCHKNNRLTLS